MKVWEVNEVDAYEDELEEWLNEREKIGWETVCIFPSVTEKMYGQGSSEQYLVGHVKVIQRIDEEKLE